MTEGAQVSAGNATVYSINFKTPHQANKFVELTRGQPDDFRWADPRDPGTTKQINFRFERNPTQAANGRAFAPFYRHILGKLQASSQFVAGMGLQVDMNKGVLQVITREDLWVLGSLLTEGGASTIKPHKANLAYFGLAFDVFEGTPEELQGGRE